MKAAFAKTDITPGRAVWMDGMIRAHRSTGVHDRLYARALALANDAGAADCYVIAALDLCGLRDEDARAVRTEAARRCGVPEDRMIIAATHTHSGPATVGNMSHREDRYVRWLIKRVAAVIVQAVRSLAPAAAGWGSGRETTISHYRRLLARDGRIVMNWEPYSPDRIIGPLGDIDPEVGVLKVVSAGRKTQSLALLFNHAGHPNVMSGNNLLISADYPGRAVELVELAFGAPALFVNGAQGTMDIDGLKDRDWTGMERVAQALAAATWRTARKIKTVSNIRIRGAMVHYALPRRIITKAEMAWARRVLQLTNGRMAAQADGVGDDYKAALLCTLRRAQRAPLRVEQTCVALGNCAWLSVPGELFTEIGMHIKAASPFGHTYIIGLANGRLGYVPTRAAIRQGGYETDSRLVDQTAGDILYKHSLALLRKVHQSA